MRQSADAARVVELEAAIGVLRQQLHDKAFEAEDEKRLGDARFINCSCEWMGA